MEFALQVKDHKNDEYNGKLRSFTLTIEKNSKREYLVKCINGPIDLGRLNENLLGKSIFDFVDNSCKRECVANFEKSFKGQVINFISYVEGVEFHTTTVPVRRGPTNRYNEVICTFVDISSLRLNQYLANHDQMTGLPNRRELQKRLDMILRTTKINSSKFAVLFLDLDRFKYINDSMGHEVGDKLLKIVADRIRNCLRSNDMVARIGGDEFVVVLPKLKSEKIAERIASRIINSLKAPIHIDQHNEIYTSASIGISIYPDHGSDINSLSKNADLSLYYAKENGKSNFKLYDTELGDRLTRKVQLGTSLRRAIEKDEFDVYYQSQIHTGSNEVIGVEALVRWNHPKLGLIKPVEFIPMAEEFDLIGDLTKLVILKACLQNKEWQKKGYQIRISINISAKNIYHPDFPDVVSKILKETNTDPKYLELEITESSIIQNVEKAINNIQTFKEMGVTISVDDFGTGNSSLNYLKRLPIDQIKIDKSFIEDLLLSENNSLIVNAIINLAKNLKLNVIAEGVETENQLKFLKSKGCQIIQGYIFSRPVTAEEFTEVLKREKCRNLIRKKDQDRRHSCTPRTEG